MWDRGPGPHPEKPQSCNVPLLYWSGSDINSEKHAGTKINTFTCYKGGGGILKFKKMKQNGGIFFKERFFKIYFTLFGRAPYIPKAISLLPSSLKIITSAPQLPENKKPLSPDAQIPKIPGAQLGETLQIN